jgi:hypothetical protein
VFPEEEQTDLSRVVMGFRSPIFLTFVDDLGAADVEDLGIAAVVVGVAVFPALTAAILVLSYEVEHRELPGADVSYFLAYYQKYISWKPCVAYRPVRN